MSRERTKPNQFQIFDANLIAANDFLEIGLEQNEQITNLFSDHIVIAKTGSIIFGTIVNKESDQIIVSINYKSNGIIASSEFNPIEYKDLTVGSIVEVMVEELENENGHVTLSYEKAKAAKAWNRIVSFYDENRAVEGVVISKVKGGLYVDIGITAFLPGSQIDTQRVTDFDEWLGKKIQVYIIKMIPKRGNVIVSRRKYMYEQKSEVRKSILDNLTEGQIIPGTVKNITKYGAFVDIGGVDGLLHITDMTWSRIDDPSEILNIGDTINVKLLSFDKDNEKISLGLKQLSENPWDLLEESIEVGSSIKGTIISIKDYGIFVEIIKGVEGLIHISEISWTDRISDLAKHFKVGQEIEALVVSLERKNRRMSLSVKQLEKSPWEAVFERYEIGKKVSGKITNIADFGFFVQIASGVDGLVHVSDISWTQHVKHPADVYKKDDMVEAIITDINKAKRKISLSIKALTENPWEKIAEILPVGTMMKGTVLKIVDFGAFIKLEDTGIEAFIHSTECSDIPNQTVDQSLQIGEERMFRILRVSAEEQKVGLSLRKQSDDKEQRKYSSRNGNSPERKDSNRSERYERSDKNDRSERPERSNDRPERSNDRSENNYKRDRDKAPITTTSSSSNASKKSNLQLELEKLIKKQGSKE